MILSELIDTPLALAQGGFAELQNIVNHAATQNFNTEQTEQQLRKLLSKVAEPNATSNATPLQPFTIDNGILTLPITGVMTKYEYYYPLHGFMPGMDDIATIIQTADATDTIKGVVLLINTYGGSTQSWIRLEEVLRARKKPVIAVVDGMCASAGIYVACFCDAILALHPTCKIGSIGVMAQLYDDQGSMNIKEFYPPESKYKNKAERDALNGDAKELIEEILSPLAKHFQQTIIDHRPNLNKNIEGVLEGKMFFAQDAVNIGLIDGICSTTQARDFTLKLAQDYTDTLNSITNI